MSALTRKADRRDRAAARLAVPVLAGVALAAACAGAPAVAHADPRFGDSTWVAPAAVLDSVSLADGPRVAPPDHARPAETVLRTPFRLAFLPLRLVGLGIDAAAGYVGPRYLDAKPARPPRRGFALGPNLAFGAVDDIGLGPALTGRGASPGAASLRVAGAWSPIDRRRASLDAALGDPRPLGFHLRADYDYKPNRRFYGIGNATPESDRSIFLLEAMRVDGALHLGAARMRQLRVVGGYASLSPQRGYHGQPRLADVFAPADAPGAHRSVHELSYGLAGDLAALDDGRDPTRGAHARAEWRHVSGLRARDLDADTWRLEARAYAPVFARRRVLAVRGVYTGIAPRGGEATSVPIELLARSDGETRFAGFPSERFRDRQLLLFRVEYRWAVLYRISALALYERGAVAPRARAFRLDETHESYGGGLRYGRSETATLRLEVARSVEGVQAALLLGSGF